MKQYFLIILGFVLIISCNSSKEKGNVNFDTITDTLIVELKPNRLVKTKQFMDGDSLNTTIAKEEYFYDNILIKENYRNYMTSEYDGFGDGEYQYFYNKEKKLIFEYYIESLSGDTVKNIYKYFKNSRDCHVLVYDYRRRLRKDMPHGDLITDEDLTEKRIWLYKTMWINTYDDKNRVIQHYIPIKDSSYTKQNRYTYRFEKDKLMEESSFLDDNKPYYSEKYEYNNDQIVMKHINYDNWPIPFYLEKTKLDKSGNALIIEKFDNNNSLMMKYINKYDEKNRLIQLDCFNEKLELKLSHRISYEIIE